MDKQISQPKEETPEPVTEVKPTHCIDDETLLALQMEAEMAVRLLRAADAKRA
jgi:hypothetical protein